MANWLKQNWFTLCVLVCFLLITSSVLYYFVLFLPRQAEVKDLQDSEANKQRAQSNGIENSQQNQIVKIEKCKTNAKNYADDIARKSYLQAFEKELAAGNTKAAQMYLEFSYKPEHPADYDGNYNFEYIKCLDN